MIFKVARNENITLNPWVTVSPGSNFCWSVLVLVIVSRFIYSLLGLKGFYWDVEIFIRLMCALICPIVAMFLVEQITQKITFPAGGLTVYSAML